MSNGVLWVIITDEMDTRNKAMQVDDLTLAGIGMAIASCQRLMDQLEERASALSAEEDEEERE